MTDFMTIVKDKKRRKAWTNDTSTLPTGLISGEAAEVTKDNPEGQKAWARYIANLSIREAREMGIKAKDVQAARNWYGDTDLKKRINARIEPPGEDDLRHSNKGTRRSGGGSFSGGRSTKGETSTSGGTWAPANFVKDPKTGKMVPPKSTASKGKGRGGTGKLKPISTADEYARMIGAEISQQQNARGLGANRYEQTPSELTPGQELAAKRAKSTVSKYASPGAPQKFSDIGAASLDSAAKWLASSTPQVTVPQTYGPEKPKKGLVKPAAKPSKPVSKKTGAEKKRKAPGAGR